MHKLGYTPAQNRTVTPVPAWAKALVPKPTGVVKTIIPGREDVERDTIPFMRKRIRETLSQTKDLAKKLKSTAGIEQTARNNFNFIFDHIKYVLDEEDVEQVRDPSAMIHQGKGDCDCFVMTLSSLLLNQGIPHYLTIMEEDPERGWSHIYITVPKSGKLKEPASRADYLVIDPVTHRFDYEATSVNKKHFPMALQSLQGLRGKNCKPSEAQQQAVEAIEAKNFYTPTMQLELTGKLDAKKFLTENSIPFDEHVEDATLTAKTNSGNLLIPTIITQEEANAILAANEPIAMDAEIVEDLESSVPQVQVKGTALGWGLAFVGASILASLLIPSPKPKNGLAGTQKSTRKGKHKVVRV